MPTLQTFVQSFFVFYFLFGNYNVLITLPYHPTRNDKI